MTLFQIALHNLKRRKSKMFFMLLGLSIASTAVVCIFTIVSSMQVTISRQLADIGANIIITANSESLSFQYGGITIPELIYDAATLSESDLETIKALPDSVGIITISPKLTGTLAHKIHQLVITGSHLPSEFSVKPWLRFHEDHDQGNSDDEIDVAGSAEEESSTVSEADGEEMVMDYHALNLERIRDVPLLAHNEIVLGSAVAAMLEIAGGEILEVNDKEYSVVAVLEVNGMADDNQVFMNLEEAQTLLGLPGELTVIELTADFKQVPLETLIRHLEDALPHATISSVSQAVTRRNELLSSFYRFGLLSGSLIFFTGLLFVALAMSSIVRERTREIGIFRAIGFRGKEVFKIITIETVLLSIFAGMAGYHGGLFTAQVIAPSLTGNALKIPWQLLPFIATVCVTALAGALAAVYPSLKAARLDPAEALRYI